MSQNITQGFYVVKYDSIPSTVPNTYWKSTIAFDDSSNLYMYDYGDTAWVKIGIPYSYIDTIDAITDDVDWLKLDTTKTTSISDDIYTMGDVGIGTSSPASQFDVVGDITTRANLYTGSEKGASDVKVRIGYGRASDGNSYIDLVADVATYPNYGLRILRATGSDGNTNITHRGNGDLNFNANEASADIAFKQGGTTRMFIENGGQVGIANTAPSTALDVNGGLRVRGVSNDDTLSNIAAFDALGNLYYREATTLTGGSHDIDTFQLNGDTLEIAIAGNPKQQLDLSPISAGSHDIDTLQLNGDTLELAIAGNSKQQLDLSAFKEEPYMITLVAESNGALAATTYEWSMGDGGDPGSNEGFVLYVPTDYKAYVVAMSLRVGGSTPSATVELDVNGVLKGSAANVSVSSANSAVNELSTPLAVNNGDILTFRTTSASGTSNTAHTVAAFIQVLK